MRTVSVSASGRYDIQLGRGIFASLGSAVRAVARGNRVMVVTDDNVAPLYLAAAEQSLSEAGFSVGHTILEAGEKSKCFAAYQALCELLAAERYSRKDLLIALGGGVVGDLVGFVAATYLRGIDYVQVPTTLLAVLDSSVGGKTAIDLAAGKNLVGAFWQPKLVLADLALLETLPEREWQSGRGEAVKYALLSRPIYEHFCRNGYDEAFYAMCIAYKRDIVEADEREDGKRKYLNLGHTVGHAVEALSGFTLAHGLCVAKGLAAAAEIGARAGVLTADRAEIMRLLSAFDLSVPYLKKDLLSYIARDKKAEGDTVDFVLLKRIGEPVIVKKTLAEWEALL